MFQFTSFPRYSYVFTVTYLRIVAGGFPHSEICGSADMYSSPQLIAAYHVLLRLPVPRHPPDALIDLTNLSLALDFFTIASLSEFLVSLNK